MQHLTDGRTDAIDDRPYVLFGAAFAAIDGGGLHGIQFRVYVAEEDGEHGYDQPAVREVYDGTSQYIDFNASGSAKLCSDTLTQNTVTGGLGYHCVMISGWRDRKSTRLNSS